MKVYELISALAKYPREQEVKVFVEFDRCVRDVDLVTELSVNLDDTLVFGVQGDVTNTDTKLVSLICVS